MRWGVPSVPVPSPVGTCRLPLNAVHPQQPPSVDPRQMVVWGGFPEELPLAECTIDGQPLALHYVSRNVGPGAS